MLCDPKPLPAAARRRLAAPLLLALAALVWAPSPAAQPASAERDGAPRGTFGETIEVRLIDVEVVVTDGEGRRVAGLGRDDFRLVVDGREVPVAFFDEVRDGRYVIPGPPAAGEDGAVADGAATAAAERPVETSYLLFIDDYFTRPPYRNRVLDGLEDDLDATGPHDRFAVVAYDGRRLEVLSDWSTSRTALFDALAAAKKRKGWRAFLEQQHLKANPQSLARLEAEQLGRTYQAVTAALRAFADVPGRRVALLLAGGWPYELNSTAFGETLGRSQLFDTSRPLKSIADVANATGFTLYPIDAPGTEDPGGGLRADNRELDSALAFRGELEGSLEEESLLRLAAWTGGEALLDAQRDRAFGPVVVDTRSYYWLSFEYPRRADGGRHEVRVEVARPGLTARSRGGFLDVSRGAEAELQAERALLLGGGEESLEVEVGEAQRHGRRMNLPFTVWIPLGEITVQPRRGGGGRARLELRVAVEDERGDRSDVSVQKLDLPLEPAMLALDKVAYDAAVTLRRQHHLLVFVLSDPASGQTWLARQEVEP